MSNIGDELFTYDTLKQAFDSDPKIQNIIADFDHNSIKIKTGEIDDVDPVKSGSGGTNVSAMAKRATDLGSL